MLENDLIEPSKSPYASPCLVVAKAYGEARLFKDFRTINKAPIHDSMPIPLIQDIFDGLGKAKYFSTIDLYAGYHQMNWKKKARSTQRLQQRTLHTNTNVWEWD